MGNYGGVAHHSYILLIGKGREGGGGLIRFIAHCVYIQSGMVNNMIVKNFTSFSKYSRFCPQLSTSHFLARAPYLSAHQSIHSCVSNFQNSCWANLDFVAKILQK